MKIQTLWLVDLLGLLLQNLSDKAFFSIWNSQTRHIFLHDFFWNLQWLTSQQQPWSIENFAQHIIQNSKIFFSLLYTELIKNSFFDNTRPVLGLRIWHQKKKEKYPKSKYMLYIQIPKTITNCQIIIPKFSSHEDPSILKIYWAQNAYLHLPI